MQFSKLNNRNMGLRIKEVCKEKHISLADVAKQIGINPVTLSQSLNGNPTLSRLQEVADVLGVDVSELFEKPVENDIHGCIFVNGKARLITSKKDIQDTLEYIETIEQQ